MQVDRLAGGAASFTGLGVTSRRDVTVSIEPKADGHGIVFALSGADGSEIRIPARADYVVNTLRNVVLGSSGARLCIVEHFLAAASLWGADDLLVRVDGMEMPLGDGSARLWIDLFQKAGIPRRTIEPAIELKEPVICRKGDRILMALPDHSFSVSYHMDWDHPAIGKRWQSWDAGSAVDDVALARTFGWLKEHQMLGLTDDVVSLTESGFSQELRFPDEPVRHKLLDLIGDLRLIGVNPMYLKARFVSIKAGHELDVEMARKLMGQIG